MGSRANRRGPMIFIGLETTGQNVGAGRVMTLNVGWGKLQRSIDLQWRLWKSIVILLSIFVLMCVLVVDSTPAMADFASGGEGAGQFEEPRGMAVDQANDDLYIADRNNNRVDEFSLNGTFVRAWGWGVADGSTHGFQTCTVSCFKGLQGSGSGQLSEPAGVAVDNDPLSPSYGDVYVEDTLGDRVEKFSPSGAFLLMFGGEVNEATKGDVCLASERCEAGKEGTGQAEFDKLDKGFTAGSIAVNASTGTVYVGDRGRVQEFTPEGEYQNQISVSGGGQIFALAVDLAGDLYVASEGLPGINKYNSSGTLLYTSDSTSSANASESGHPTALALDAAGDLFVDDEGEPGGEVQHHILEYSSLGSELSVFDWGEEDGFRGLADVETEGHSTLYVLDKLTVRMVRPPPPGPVLLPASGLVRGIGPTSVTIDATVNPEDNTTAYGLEYGLTETYGSSISSPQDIVPASFGDEPIKIEVGGLKPSTKYHYRIVIKNADGEDRTLDAVFTTLPAVSIESESVSDVKSTSATFQAQINPLGVEATYRIEYGTSSAYGTSTPEAVTGTGTTGINVSTHIQGLTQYTLYHYRVVARDVREGIEYEVDGPDRIFTTLRPSGALILSDGRQWELVSPADKNGALIQGISEAGVVQAAASGGAMTYLANAPVPSEHEPQGFTNEVQVFSSRSPKGWSIEDIAPPHQTATGESVGFGQEYRAFSEDLCLSLVEPLGEFTASVSSLASERTPFERQQCLCGQEESANKCYFPLVTGTEGYADVPTGTEFGGNPKNLTGPVKFVGGTPDLSHIVLSSTVALTTTALKNSAGLYEWSAGLPPSMEIQLASLLPKNEGGSPGTNPVLGAEGKAANAISDDGARIFWTERHTPRALYLRDIATNETVRLDLPQGINSSGASEPVFQIASSDGTKVFFTDSQRLLDHSGKTGQDLYECAIVEEAGNLACALTDLTPELFGSPAGVQGAVLGASEDTSYVYFVATGTLTESENSVGEKPVLGRNNLYVMHYGSQSGHAGWEQAQFITVLSNEDERDWATDLAHHTARVSPDGRYLAFMSNMPLNGYDNRDEVSGEPDEEVYLYDASTGRLLCTSCDPTGERPVGVEYGAHTWLVGGFNVLKPTNWFAGNIPGWTPFELNEARYQARYLSDEGRLFFDSDDALVPQDVNGTEDVYEYEPVGIGDCGMSSDTFEEKIGGCVQLLSSGTSAEESAFLDASTTGNDAFFLTSDKLVVSDTDTAPDVYDARVCTEEAPCIEPATAISSCLTAEACRSAPEPLPEVFGAPASSTFSGAGNVLSLPPKPSVTSRHITRKQMLARALKNCRKMKKKKSRTICERRANMRYGAVKKHQNIVSPKGKR